MNNNCVWLVAMSLLGGCAPSVKTDYPILVHVESDKGVPLEHATLSLAGTVLGESDASGLAALTLHGHPGDVVPLEVTCPAEHRSPDAPVSVLLRPLAPRARRPEFYAACPPLVRQLVVAVRARDGANLPLRYLGRELARTDSHGVAHALLTAAPGDTLRLTLDTSAPEHAQLMPQQPELRLTMPERDHIVVFEQPFTRPKPKARPHPRREPAFPQRL